MIYVGVPKIVVPRPPSSMGIALLTGFFYPAIPARRTFLCEHIRAYIKMNSNIWVCRFTSASTLS